MTLRVPPSSSKAPQFKGSLIRTFVIGLLLLSLLPVVLTGVVTFLRTQTLLEDQLKTQMTSVGDNYAQQLAELAFTRQKALQQITNEKDFANDLVILNLNKTDDPNLAVARARITGNFITFSLSPTERIFEQIFLVGRDGRIMAATDGLQTNKQWPTTGYLSDLIGGQKTALIFDVAPYYSNQFAFVSTYSYSNAAGTTFGTLVGFAKADLATRLLTSSSAFFGGARSYFVTANGSVISTTPGVGQVVQYQASSSQIEKLNGLIGDNPVGHIETYASFDNTVMLGYLHWIPSLQSGFVVEQPQALIIQQVQSLLPYNLILVGIALLITGVVAFFGTSRIVNPLVQLSSLASGFAAGNWTERAKVNRRDEIGLLAYTFNVMVDRLSELYRSLEMKVEERTRQLRTASEVAQVAISATSRDEIIQQTVDLIIQRFGFHYAAIYLLDETGSYAILRSGSVSSGELKISTGYRVPLSSQTLIAWVAANNQPRIAEDITIDDPSYRSETLMAATRSAIVVPIALGTQVLGVIDVQSTEPNAFDQESGTVFQTLANQIATGLRTVLSLEAAKVNLEETSLLYRASRQITQSQDEEDALKVISATLGQTNYVAFILAVEEDHLRLLSMTDPRGGTSDSSMKGLSIPLQKGIASLAHSGMVIAEDLQSSTDFFNLLIYFDRRGCRAAAIIPIFEDGKVSKVMAVGSREKGVITPVSMQPFANFAEVVANTLDRFHVMGSLQLRLSELQTLNNVSVAISTETELEGLYQALQIQVNRAFGDNTAFIVALYNAQDNMIQIPYAFEGNERLYLDPMPLGEGLTSILIRTGKPLLLDRDTEKTAQRLGARIAGKTAKSWMGVPLILGGQIIGALVVQDVESEGRFNESDLNLFSTLAPQVATSIRNAQLLMEMKAALGAYDQERFLLNALLDNIPDRVYFKDSAGIYLRVSNSVAVDWNLKDPTVVVGKTDDQLFGKEEGDLVNQADQAVLSTGIPEIGAVQRIDSADGQSAWRLNSKIPLLDETGLPVGLLGISRDITELKRTEEVAERRASQLLTAAEIARDTSGTLETSETLNKAVNLVRDRFGFYHASIFLLDPLAEYAVLQESTGEAGARLKQAGHKLAVGSRSIIGQTTALGTPIVVNDVRKDPNYYPNPLLPDTRAELAIPMKVGNQILGALDVQSIHPDAFSDEDISILQVLADQLAVAVVNANLFAETQASIAQHQLLHEITTLAGAAVSTDEALRIVVQSLHNANPNDQIAIFVPNAEGKLVVVSSAGYSDTDLSDLQILPGEGIIGKVALGKKPVSVRDTKVDRSYIPLVDGTRSELSVPILYGDSLLGVLNLESSNVAAYDETDQEIIATLGNNLGSIIANINLVNQVRRQVERQHQLFELTSKIRRSTDIETILQTSINEIGRVMRARHGTIHISSDNEPLSGGNGNGHDIGKDQEL